MLPDASRKADIVPKCAQFGMRCLLNIFIRAIAEASFTSSVHPQRYALAGPEYVQSSCYHCDNAVLVPLSRLVTYLSNPDHTKAAEQSSCHGTFASSFVCDLVRRQRTQCRRMNKAYVKLPRYKESRKLLYNIIANALHLTSSDHPADNHHVAGRHPYKHAKSNHRHRCR